jgi:hypothetical protein
MSSGEGGGGQAAAIKGRQQFRPLRRVGASAATW